MILLGSWYDELWNDELLLGAFAWPAAPNAKATVVKTNIQDFRGIEFRGINVPVLLRLRPVGKTIVLV